MYNSRGKCQYIHIPSDVLYIHDDDGDEEEEDADNVFKFSLYFNVKVLYELCR